MLFRSRLEPGSAVLMLEDLGIASAYRYHRLRLLHTFVAMRAFAAALRRQGHRVRYGDLAESEQRPFWQRLGEELDADPAAGREAEPLLRVSAVPDRGFQTALERFCADRGAGLEILPSPAFLESEAESRAWFSGRRRPFMKTFYERQRRRLGLLLDADGGPIGGRWSYDSENRRRLPKGYREPPLPLVAPSPEEGAVRGQIDRFFPHNPGAMGSLFIPWDQVGAEAWLESFLSERLAGFGPYEDALSVRHDTLHHSLLSPLLNIGLLTPQRVVERTLALADQRGVALDPPAGDASGGERSGPLPIASLEGFLRQVIGWREFVRGIDLVHGEAQANANHWNHQRRLAPCWDDASTGLPPLDAAIERVNRLAYNQIGRAHV